MPEAKETHAVICSDWESLLETFNRREEGALSAARYAAMQYVETDDVAHKNRALSASKEAALVREMRNEVVKAVRSLLPVETEALQALNRR